MTYTLLFDLDDTLLDTNIESFIPAYFQALSGYMAPYVKPEVMLPALLSATQLMMDSEDPSRTLEEVFDQDFYGRIGISKNEISELLDEFYDTVFPKLNVTTDPRPEAVPLIEWVLSKGFRVAIATDPLFPRKATYHRLRWAGFDPGQFELISTFENFHFSKTHAAYYAEMLGQLGWPEGPVVMVGNDMQRDLIPADRLGLTTFLIEGGSASSFGPEAGRGKLADFRPWLESQNPTSLEPSFKSPEAIMAIMCSTPAVLSSLIGSLPQEQWVCEPSSDDWTLNEVVCHLRDTDIEIHALQLQLMIEKEGAFIPRPDSSIWANEREYLQVNGVEKLREFTSARIQNIKTIRNMGESLWSRKARHAIFGPTNFTEVVSFIADHDRAHIQQVWKTLKTIQCERV
ncbi:MAG TPA: DinB family protein [Anaerolineales bacterium]|nr:DinB family protein [Anaerolineales bacterium]